VGELNPLEAYINFKMGVIMESKTLYSDNLITIESDEITFSSSYFPLGKKKSISVNQIESIITKKPTLWSGKYRISGTGNFKTWFPADLSRTKRDLIFIAKLKGKWIDIGFTVENSNKVLSILEEMNLIKA